MSFHKQEFHQRATKSVLQAVLNNINALNGNYVGNLNEKNILPMLSLDYHGISPQWINLRYDEGGSNLVTTKGKNEMLTVLNALQQYLMQVEGKQFR